MVYSGGFYGTDICFSIKHRCVTPLYHIPLGIFDCVLSVHAKPVRGKAQSFLKFY